MRSQAKRIWGLIVMLATPGMCAACPIGISGVDQTTRVEECDPIVRPSQVGSEEAGSTRDDSVAIQRHRALELFDRGKIVVVAHRGFAHRHPENTIVAIERAFELGADAVEVDVQITRDGVPILMHDATVNRTTNGTGSVADLDFVEIAALDACSWFGDQWLPCKVPTLREALVATRNHDGVLLLDLKPPMNTAELISILHDVQCTEMASGTIIMSFDLGIVSRMREMAPSVPVGLTTQQAPNPRELREARLRFAAVSKLVLQENPLYPSELANHQLATMAWTVTKESEVAFLTSTGAHFLITDIPLTISDSTSTPNTK